MDLALSVCSFIGLFFKGDVCLFWGFVCLSCSALKRVGNQEWNYWEKHNKQDIVERGKHSFIREGGASKAWEAWVQQQTHGQALGNLEIYSLLLILKVKVQEDSCHAK